MRDLFVIPALLATCLLTGCAEEKPIARRSSFSGMSPVPTRTSEPRGTPSNAGGGGDDFFAPIGDGITSMFEEKGDKNQRTWDIITPLGQKIHLAKNYTGQTVFRTREGRAYRLTFNNGALVMIEDEILPGGPGKPGMTGTGKPGAPGTGGPGKPGTPPPIDTDEGEVPRPTGPRPPVPGE